MIRATTPTLQFIMPAGMYDGCKEILITFKQGNKILFDKHKEDLIDKTDVEANRYDIHLSQKDTILFDQGLTLRIQVRFLTIYGEAYASNEKLMKVCNVLNDKEMV